jgi:hypothetical protein
MYPRIEQKHSLAKLGSNSRLTETHDSQIFKTNNPAESHIIAFSAAAV